jgi:hypothetical protein
MGWRSSLFAAAAVMCAPQVRSDCPPRQLVEFLVSDTGVMADQVCAQAGDTCGRMLMMFGSCTCAGPALVIRPSSCVGRRGTSTGPAVARAC